MMKNLLATVFVLCLFTQMKSQVFIDPCMDLGEVDFGFCDMAMGIAVVNGECAYASGCSWEVGGIDYSPAFYTSFESC